MKKLKSSIGVAIVGAGFAARFHTTNLRRVHGVDVRLVGVFSRREEAAEKFVREHSFEKSYKNFTDLLNDPEVDLVDACLPTGSHEEIAIKSLQAGKDIIIEKPLTGCFVPGKDAAGWERCLSDALASADRMIKAEEQSPGRILYAENWVYAPGVQKARRLMEAAATPILRVVGEESHSGTHSSSAMEWKTSGGGSLLHKGCHPLGGAIYLKHSEGQRRLGRNIRPCWVSASVANLTKSEAFSSSETGSIRTGWVDCEDWATMVVGFDDGSVAQISAADTVVGGIQNLMSVYAKRATVHINMNPNTAVLSYAPDSEAFSNEYLREKTETTAGWQFTNPDEDWMNGFPSEMQDFCESVATGREPLSGSALAREVVAVCYSAYLSAATGRRVKILSA